MKLTVMCKFKKEIKVLVERPVFAFSNDPLTRDEPNIVHEGIESSDVF